MADHLLYVPGYAISPRACDETPALQAALEALREHFEITIFHWPTVKGGADIPLTWQSVADAIRHVLPDGGHVLCGGGNITFVLMALQDAHARLRSIVSDGFDIPVATFEALGLKDEARATEAIMQIDMTSFQSALAWMPEATSEEVREVSQRMYGDCNWSQANEFAVQASSLNLLKFASPDPTPTLLINSGMPYTGWGALDILQRFLPNSEQVEMPRWKVHEPESGTIFANLVIEFMQKHSGRAVLTTVLFADIVDSTVQAAALGGSRWAQVLGQFHALVQRELHAAGGKLVDTAGDGFLAVFDDPGAAIRCAAVVSRKVADLGVETRSGVHTGQVEVSGEKYSGVAVHTAARVAAEAKPGEVLASETVRQLLVGTATEFEDRGSHALKGLPEPVRLYAAAAKS